MCSSFSKSCICSWRLFLSNSEWPCGGSVGWSQGVLLCGLQHFFSLEEAENGSSPSLLCGTQRYKYLWLQGDACVVFLLHADPGQGSEASEVSAGPEKSYLGWVSQNSRMNNFFSLFTSSKIPTTITCHRIPSTAPKSCQKSKGSWFSSLYWELLCFLFKDKTFNYLTVHCSQSGLMGHFSYLLACSKAKTFGYYSRSLHVLSQSSVGTVH